MFTYHKLLNENFNNKLTLHVPIPSGGILRPLFKVKNFLQAILAKRKH